MWLYGYFSDTEASQVCFRLLHDDDDDELKNGGGGKILKKSM